MSARASGWVWGTSASAGNDRLVLLAIADQCDHDGRNGCPGADLLMEMTKLGRSTVYDCIRRLKGLGELSVQTIGGGRGRRTYYALPKMATNRPETGRKQGSQTVQDPDNETVQNLDPSLEDALGTTGNLNRPETVRKPSSLDAQNGNTLTLTQKIPPSGGATSPSPDGEDPQKSRSFKIQELVGFYVDECTSFGYPPISNWRARIGKEIKSVIDEKSEDLIRWAIGVLAEEHKTPAALVAVITDLEARRNGVKTR